jgi:hypothetical protein
VNQPGSKSPWLRTILILIAVLAVCSVGFALVHSKETAASKVLDKKIAELDATFKEMDDLIKASDQWEADLEDCADRLKRYDLPVEDPDQVPPELTALGLNTVAKQEIEPKLISDLSTLAKQSGCELVEYKPGKYEQRRVEVDPRKAAASKTDEDKKKADESWKKLAPEKKEKIERDAAYVQKLNETKKFADVQELELRIRGTLEDVQRFVCGLSRWPTNQNFMFPHLVMVVNVRIRAINSTSAPIPIGTNPELDADLSTRLFSLKPIDFSEKAPARSGAGDSAQPRGGAAGGTDAAHERQPART